MKLNSKSSNTERNLNNTFDTIHCYSMYSNTCATLFCLYDFLDLHKDIIKKYNKYENIYYSHRKIINTYIDLLTMDLNEFGDTCSCQDKCQFDKNGYLVSDNISDDMIVESHSREEHIEKLKEYARFFAGPHTMYKKVHEMLASNV
jgi:hypothetical protein